MTPTIHRRADRTQSTLDSLFLESRAAAPSPPPPPPPASMAAVPVLSVAFDKVDKQDDCHALWQVFSRCRDAIDDGARLENLSWRLWNRNLAGAKRGPCDGAAPPAAGAHFSLGVSDSELSGFTSDSSESPSSAGGSGADEAAITARSDCARRADVRPAPLSNSHPGPGSGAVRPVLEPRSRSSPDLHPGRFISELLPNRLVVPSAGRPSVPLPPPPSSPRSPLVQRPLLETVIMPSTPPSAAAGAGCPAVVVVNPTPHPTPPATPRVPDEVPHVPHVQTHIQPSVSSATLRVPASVLPTTHPAPGEHEADGRKAAPTMFFLCHEPNTPEHSPDSESSTMAPNLMAAAAAAAATAVNAKPRDSALPPPLSRSISTSSRSLDEASVDMPGSATSSSFRPPSSIGSASRQRKGKEPVRHHVGTRAVGRPAFAHRVSHTKPTSRTVSPAKRQLQQPAPALATQQPPEAPVTAPPPPAAVVPATGASNKPRADPVMPNPAVAPVAAPPAAREPTLAPTTRPISPQAARVSLFKTLLAPANRRVELATSSEFDSDSADDSSWASEDDSAGDGVERGPDIAREAALEAQRQREMFAKLPTRSYSNLDQLPQTGLLTSMFHPERVAQASSTRDVLAAAARTTSAPSLQMVGRSPVAAPLIQQVTAQPTLSNTQYRTGYRPRGRPEDEPEDTDTDEDDPEDTVQVSQSVAQRRLAALAGRHLQQQQRSQQPTQQQQLQQSPEQQQFQQQQQPLPQAGPSALPNGVAVAPIPFTHAHLPVPLPPQTPRTTRRNMLASEMSESLRRNLLWERQVTKRSHGLPRNTSAGSRLQPLTSLAGANEPIDEREARRRAAIARNRSWADDFHTSGW